MISFQPFFTRQSNTHTNLIALDTITLRWCLHAYTRKRIHLRMCCMHFFRTTEILADVRSSTGKERIFRVYLRVCEPIFDALAIWARFRKCACVYTLISLKYSISRENNVWGVDFAQASFCWIHIDCHRVSYHGHSLGEKCLRRSVSLSLLPILPFVMTLSPLLSVTLFLYTFFFGKANHR